MAKKSRHEVHLKLIEKVAVYHDYEVNSICRFIQKTHPDLFKTDKVLNESLQEYVKKIILGMNRVKLNLNDMGISYKTFSHGWVKTEEGSFFIKQSGELADEDVESIVEKFTKRVKKRAPKYNPFKYTHDLEKSKHMMIVDIADLHLQMLTSEISTGSTYTVRKLKKLVVKAVARLCEQASAYNVTNIIFVGGNDALHVDNTVQTTTAGTKQETQLLWHDAFNEALQLYTEVIEGLLAIAPVHYVYCPSNHDYMSGYLLSKNIETWFRHSEHFTCDVTPAHRKYAQFGNSLFGFTHGDGAKDVDLPSLMNYEAREYISDTKFRYWISHHLHHKQKKSFEGTTGHMIEKDYKDVKVIQTNAIKNRERQTTVEVLRSANPASCEWAAKSGYVGSPTGIEAFIFQENDGEIARFAAYY